MSNPPERSPGTRTTASLDPPRPEADRVTFGRLIDHGSAPHEFVHGAADSYFVRIETPRGERVFWSPALRAAMADSRSKPQVGEEVGVRENSILPATAIFSQRDGAGKVVGQRRYDTPRTHWAVEQRAFYDEAALAAEALRNERVHPREAVKTYPQLLPAYLALDSARRIAAERVSVSQRARFVGLVRETLALAIERAMPLPELQMRASAKQVAPTRLDNPTLPQTPAPQAQPRSVPSPYPPANGPRVTTRSAARTR